MIVGSICKTPDCIYKYECELTCPNQRAAGRFKLCLPCSVTSQEQAMTFSTIATSSFFPLHRLHKPVVVTVDGVDHVDGLLTGPLAMAAVLLDAADALPLHYG